MENLWDKKRKSLEKVKDKENVYIVVTSACMKGEDSDFSRVSIADDCQQQIYITTDTEPPI